MELLLYRYSTSLESTLGILFSLNNKRAGREFLCYTIEDTYRDKKIMNHTRIPSGKYEIKYRTEGGFYNKYKTRFADIDNKRGMLELQNVPNFKYILIHCGNTSADSSGCLLVADSVNNNQNEKGFAGKSSIAYKNIYKRLAGQLDKGDKVYITIEDFDS
tara:strand:- start:2308 stop:2787 length:480 start_codon:yes stop_codon:yes gene_type:complete